MFAFRLSAAISLALVTATGALAKTSPESATVTIALLPARTKSVEIDIYHVGGKTPGKSEGPWLFNVTPGAKGCSPVRSGFTCTRSIPMPYGTFDFSVTAFAERDVAGNAIARGKTTATIGAARKLVNVAVHPSA